MGRDFPVREKSGNFEQTGIVRENNTEYWKIQGISDKYIICYFLVIFKCTVYHLLTWVKFSDKNRTLKIYSKNGKKSTGKVREFCHSGKVGTMIQYNTT